MRGWLKYLKGTKFKGYTPDDLVEYQFKARREANNGGEFEILDAVVAWVKGTKGEGRIGYQQACIKAIRSFFKHNRIPLPDDPGLNLNSSKPMVPTKLTALDIKRIIDRTHSPAFRAVYMVMFQTGLDQESTVNWSNSGWRDLKAQLEESRKIIKVTVPGRKGSKNKTEFTTSFGGDALTELNKYVEKVRGWDDGPIFINQFGDAITKSALAQFWIRQLRSVQLDERVDDSKIIRYGRGLHSMRDVMKTIWNKTNADKDVVEWRLGHYSKVDVNNYDHRYEQDDYMAKEFKKALPYLNLLTDTRPFGLVKEDIVEEQMDGLRVEIEGLKSGRSSEMEALKDRIKDQGDALKDIAAFLSAPIDEANRERRDRLLGAMARIGSGEAVLASPEETLRRYPGLKPKVKE